MNNKVELATRLQFRDWLRQELRKLDFYQRRGDHYLIREFAKYCAEHGSPIDEASLGRYLRDEEPVLPTPERCRALARVLEYAPVHVLIQAGYLEGDDLFTPLPKDLSADKVAEALVERQNDVARAVKSASGIAPLTVIVEQMQLATGEMAGRMASRDAAPEYRKELEKLASHKSSGPGAAAAEALEEFNKAHKQIAAGERAPVKEREPVRAKRGKREKVEA